MSDTVHLGLKQVACPFTNNEKQIIKEHLFLA
jgi:hypothetical protein